MSVDVGLVFVVVDPLSPCACVCVCVCQRETERKKKKKESVSVSACVCPPCMDCFRMIPWAFGDYSGKTAEKRQGRTGFVKNNSPCRKLHVGAWCFHLIHTFPSGGKILLSPWCAFMNSRMMSMLKLGEMLVQDGHEVSVIVPSFLKHKMDSKTFKVVTFEVRNEKTSLEWYIAWPQQQRRNP